MGDTDVAAGPAEPAQDGERRPWTNFGGNQTFEAVFRQPQNDEQVLALLARHRDDRIRAVGAGHSWSEVATGAGIALDMSGFAEVRAFVRTAGVRRDRRRLPAARYSRSAACCGRRDAADVRRHHAPDRRRRDLDRHARLRQAEPVAFRRDRAVADLRCGPDSPMIVTVGRRRAAAARCALGCMGVDPVGRNADTVPRTWSRNTVRSLRDPRRGASPLCAIGR